MKSLLFPFFFILSNPLPIHSGNSQVSSVYSIAAFQKDLVKAQKIENFFNQRNMPLADYSIKFVEVANKNNLPYNFLPAIAIVESNGGKAGTRATKNKNPFGFGSKKIVFEDFGEAIDVIGHKLAHHKYYKNKTLTQKLYVYNQEDKEYREKVFKYMRLIDREKI